MSIIQSEDLEARGLLNDQSSALEIQGKCFKPGPSFPKSSCQIAIEFCEEARSQGRRYILIEFPTYFMTWRRYHPQASTQSQAIKSLSTEASLSSSPVTSKRVPCPPTPSNQDEYPTPSNRSGRGKTQVIDGVNIDDEFIKRCEAELAMHIGPMAKIIIGRVLSQSGDLTSEQLIEALATHISDPQASRSFTTHFGFLYS